MMMMPSFPVLCWPSDLGPVSTVLYCIIYLIRSLVVKSGQTRQVVENVDQQGLIDYQSVRTRKEIGNSERGQSVLPYSY